MGNLGIDSAVEGADGRYTAVLSKDWEIWGPNGGYLAAVALRAAGAHVRERIASAVPASLLCHYVGVAAFDVVDLSVSTLRAAKRAESVRVSMTQGGQPVLEALVWAVADGLDGVRHDVAERPADVGEPESYRSLDELTDRHPFFDNVDQRPLVFIDDWEGRRAAEPTLQCWTRFRPQATFPDDPWADASRLAVLVDTFQWPAAVRAYDQAGLQYVAPSLDLSCQFHRSAADHPWLFTEAHSPVAESGLVAGTARVWDADGRLVASGSQQMLCRPVRSGDLPPPRPQPPTP